MSNPYYNYTDGQPIASSRGLSTYIQNEFAAIGAGFDAVQTAIAAAASGGLSSILPSQTGKANRPLISDGTSALWSTDAYFGSSAGFGTTTPLARVSIVKNTTVSLPALPATTVLHLAEADGVSPLAVIDSYGASGGAIAFRRTGGNAASPLAVSQDNVLGEIRAYGYGATGYSSAARSLIRFNAVEAWSDTAQGTYLSLFTTKSATINLLEQLRVTDKGHLQFMQTGQRIIGDFSNATLTNRLYFQDGTTNNPTVIGALPNGSSTDCALSIYNNSNPTNAARFTLYANAADCRLASEISGTGSYLPLAIYAGGFERLKVYPDSNVGIAATAGSVVAGGYWFSPNSGASWLAIGHANGVGNGNWYQAFNYNGTTIGTISQATTSSVAYNTTSDYRLKIIDGEITDSGVFIDGLRPVFGSWKGGGEPFAGFIAHEVQRIAKTSVVTGKKDAVNEDGDPVYQAMDYSSGEMIANIVAELKSVRKRLSVLENQAA